MSDALKRLSDTYDRERTPPQWLQRLSRGEAYEHRICIACRRVPDEAAQAEYAERWAATSDPVDYPRPHVGPNCPHCGGRLVAVTL